MSATRYVIRSEQEQGYWHNTVGWVLSPWDATLFVGERPTSLPSIGVPDCRVMPIEMCEPFMPF